MTMEPHLPRNSTSPINDVMGHVSSLFRKEVDLARAELHQNLTKAAMAIGLLVGAIVIALVALNVLATALVVSLVELGIAPVWSSIIVGISFAAIALAMTTKGLNNLKASSLAPTRTVESVERDVTTLKESIL